MRLKAMIALFGTGLALAGCVTEETQRIEGLTPGAGNALAANTAMQMVDPWQYGVQDTDLQVPADSAGATAVSKAPGSTTSDSSVTGGSSGGTSN